MDSPKNNKIGETNEVEVVQCLANMAIGVDKTKTTIDETEVDNDTILNKLEKVHVMIVIK